MANPPTLHQRLKREGRDPFVLNRIRNSEVMLRRSKKKTYEFRKLVAGDFGSIVGNQKSVEEGSDKNLRIDNLYNFIVNCFDDDGYSNRILQTIKVLLMTISYSAPDVEFRDLKFEEAALNSGWLKARLAERPIGCGAAEEMRFGLLDYLIGGMGWSNSCISEQMPALRSTDSLDMNYDYAASMPSRIRWASCTYREPLHYWLSLFGTKGFEEEIIAAQADITRLDQIIAVDYYFDLDTSKNGSFYAFKRNDGGQLCEAPVYQGDNPNYFLRNGVRQPFVPYEPLYFMQLPSLAQPMGVVEQLLAPQMSLWMIEESQRAYLERGAPFYTVKKGSLSDENRAALENGIVGAIVETEDGSPITRSEGIQIDPNIMNERSYHERQFTAMSGTNPYSLGSPVEGIEYSREVSEISGMSGLTVAYVSKDHAAWWARSARKVLAVGAVSDDMPITIQIGDVGLSFDAFNPVKQYLRPLADLVASEESTRFAPASQRVNEAINDIKVAQMLGERFPNAMVKAAEKYFRARGEKNIAEILQERAPVGMPPQAPPDAVATA